MHAWSKSMLLLLLSTFMLSLVKMSLKGEIGGGALNSHGNCIVEHGKSWKNHGIVFLNFSGNPVKTLQVSIHRHSSHYTVTHMHIVNCTHSKEMT